MTRLVDALQTENTLTENGMTTNSSSLNHCVNFFSQIGAMRGKNESTIISLFSKAYAENALTALKIAFWVRDVRGGAGEREIFRIIAKYLAKNHTKSIANNISLISEYGRWDDVVELIGTKLEKQALDVISAALRAGNGLCAKWCPRPNVSSPERKKHAKVIMTHMKLSPKQYRKLLVSNSNTVEQAMCAKDWTKIEYSKLPSKAMSNYLKAFGRNDFERFDAYIKALENGDTKVNAGAVYPYDIIKSMVHSGNNALPNQQWKALPNFLEGNTERLLPVCDVSGSMSCPAGNNKNVTCLDVCISLGLYISERNDGAFKDTFMTFSHRPKLQVLNGTLSARHLQLRRADWEMNTDLEAMFDLLLNQAVKHSVPENEMPTMILIMSDMEFDSATRGENLTAQKLIDKKYSDAGYTMPKIVYWNLNARNENFPVKFNESGTAMISGFSPSILKSLLGGKDLSPIAMMRNTIDVERYKAISL